MKKRIEIFLQWTISLLMMKIEMHSMIGTFFWYVKDHRSIYKPYKMMHLIKIIKPKIPMVYLGCIAGYLGGLAGSLKEVFWDCLCFWFMWIAWLIIQVVHSLPSQRILNYRSQTKSGFVGTLISSLQYDLDNLSSVSKSWNI